MSIQQVNYNVLHIPNFVIWVSEKLGYGKPYMDFYMVFYEYFGENCLCYHKVWIYNMYQLYWFNHYNQ